MSALQLQFYNLNICDFSEIVTSSTPKFFKIWDSSKLTVDQQRQTNDNLTAL